VTGLFMAAWNGDQAAKHEFLAQRAIQRTAIAAADPDGDAGAITDTGWATTVQVAGPMPKAVPSSDHVVNHFRPDGMAAGRYRAVSESGVTFELTVDNNTTAAARDFYMADSPQGTRWYFVRVDTAG
jgi:hypothetical protein